MDERVIDKAVIRSSASRIYRQKVLIRASSIVLLAIFAILLTSFGVSSFINSIGGFTINLTDMAFLEKGIAISNTKDLSNCTIRLKADKINECDNISYLDIPLDVGDFDGSHNGNNYLAYTFYLVNSGELTVDLIEEIVIISSVKNVDEAVRVKVIKDGVETVYAKARTSDGLPEEVPYGIVSFVDDTKVYSKSILGFNPESIIKYTVLIWLEGDDPECVDKIRGGEIRFAMNFSIIEDDVS